MGVWGLAEKGHRYGLIEGVGEAATKRRGNGSSAARGWGEGKVHLMWQNLSGSIPFHVI